MEAVRKISGNGEAFKRIQEMTKVVDEAIGVLDTACMFYDGIDEDGIPGLTAIANGLHTNMEHVSCMLGGHNEDTKRMFYFKEESVPDDQDSMMELTRSVFKANEMDPGSNLDLIDSLARSEGAGHKITIDYNLISDVLGKVIGKAQLKILQNDGELTGPDARVLCEILEDCEKGLAEVRGHVSKSIDDMLQDFERETDIEALSGIRENTELLEKVVKAKKAGLDVDELLDGVISEHQEKAPETEPTSTEPGA